MKVRTISIAALAAATLFASCNKDNGIVSDEKGDPTLMTVSINFPKGPQTRSTVTDDPFATDGEAKINHIDVFIYNSMTGSFLSHTNLTGDDFTKKPNSDDRDRYDVTATIPTTTGNRIVFAGINLPEGLVSEFKNKPVDALANVPQEMGKADLTGSSENSFAMFSVEGVEKSFTVDETANKVTLVCQRLVAKVTVEQAPKMEVNGISGALINLEYGINNFNKKTFLLQGTAPYKKDPNWAKGSYNEAEFVQLADFSDYKSVAEFVDNYTVSSAPLYVSENTSEGKTKRELTRATVRGQIIPKEVAHWDGATLSHNPNSNYPNDPASFYSVIGSIYDGTYYFIDETMANEFAAYKNDELGYTGDREIKPIKYTDGSCYWDIFLNKTPRTPNGPENKWDVLRNDFYRCKITHITTPGRSGPDLEDGGGGGTGPDVPPDAENTNISVDIEILFWNVLDVEPYELY